MVASSLTMGGFQGYWFRVLVPKTPTAKDCITLSKEDRMHFDIRDNRKVSIDMVREAANTALQHARENFPDATLKELWAHVTNEQIYNNWMPKLFGKKGSYGRQVGRWVTMIRQESLAGEGVVEVCAASAPELCAVIAAEFRKFEANLNGSMASLRNTIAATNEANAVKMFQQGEASGRAEVLEFEERAKSAERESAAHLATAATIEDERDDALQKLREMGLSLAQAREQVAVANATTDLCAGQLQLHATRAETLLSKTHEAHAALAAAGERIEGLIARAEQAESERDTARKELVELRDAEKEAAKKVAALLAELRSSEGNADRALRERDQAKVEAKEEREKADKAVALHIEATGLAASPSEQLKKAKQQNEDVCDQVEGMG